MASRKIGSFDIKPVGLGCMNLSHVYGSRPTEMEARLFLNHALDLGCNHLDTAALYGFGANEKILGRSLKSRRGEYFLASKCGMTGVDGKKKIDGHPKTLRRTVEQALRNLQTDVIDLYYLHRWDKSIPIEDSIGEMSRFVEEGKVKLLGLSEVSAATLRKANAAYPISAIQSEYSLWTRNSEISVLKACRELGITFIAYCPLARGFLTRKFENGLNLEEADLRTHMPRFQGAHWEVNQTLIPGFIKIAVSNGLTPAQLALAWVMGHGDHVHVIPGTTKLENLKDNLAAADKMLSESVKQAVSQLINQKTVSGPRYGSVVQLEIDTEDFALC